MKIHAGLLTHNNTSAGVGKVLDLGFNGDFDYKNHSWNMVFVATAGGNGHEEPVVVEVFSSDDYTAVSAGNPASRIASITIPVESLGRNGRVYGFTMPKGVKRYFTIKVDGNPDFSTGITVTAGITDDVDTDVVPGVDWTYYKADTTTSEVKGVMSEAMEAIFPEANE